MSKVEERHGGHFRGGVPHGGQIAAHDEKGKEGAEDAPVDHKVVGKRSGQRENRAKANMEWPTPFDPSHAGTHWNARRHPHVFKAIQRIE